MPRWDQIDFPVGLDDVEPPNHTATHIQEANHDAVLEQMEQEYHNERRARLADALGTNDLPDWYTVFQNINAWRTDEEDGDYEIGNIVISLNLGDNVADFKNHLIIYANTFSTPGDPSDWVERVLPVIDQAVEQNDNDNDNYDNDAAGQNRRKPNSQLSSKSNSVLSMSNFSSVRGEEEVKDDGWRGESPTKTKTKSQIKSKTKSKTCKRNPTKQSCSTRVDGGPMDEECELSAKDRCVYKKPTKKNTVNGGGKKPTKKKRTLLKSLHKKKHTKRVKK